MSHADFLTTRFARLLAALSGDGPATRASLGPLTLSSHFQPIYSLSHGRVVGHEALMRACEPGGAAVSPLAVFASCDTPVQTAWCDSLTRMMHMANFARDMPAEQWLFLNINPVVFDEIAAGELAETTRNALGYYGLRAEQIVVEVLENAIGDNRRLEEAVDLVRAQGFLVALDDFGAGHSNFDRVWRLRPDIVKLDRSLVSRAATDRRSQRMIAQMVSLLHECGALVLMEGVETEHEALIAVDSDVDMVQGYFFARPSPALVQGRQAPPVLANLYERLEGHRQQQRQARRELLAPYINAMGYAAYLLGAQRQMDEACASFLDLPLADICYQLDAEGRQIGQVAWSRRAVQALSPAYAPLRDADGAVWSRRPYFKRAIEAPGKVQVTRPYRTLQGGHLCITVSAAVVWQQDGRSETRVLCGDFIVEEQA